MRGTDNSFTASCETLDRACDSPKQLEPCRRTATGHDDRKQKLLQRQRGMITTNTVRWASVSSSAPAARPKISTAASAPGIPQSRQEEEQACDGREKNAAQLPADAGPDQGERPATWLCDIVGTARRADTSKTEPVPSPFPQNILALGARPASYARTPLHPARGVTSIPPPRLPSNSNGGSPAPSPQCLTSLSEREVQSSTKRHGIPGICQASRPDHNDIARVTLVEDVLDPGR